MDRSRNGRSAVTRMPAAGPDRLPAPRARQRALCIGASPDRAELSELSELLLTAGVASVGELTQSRVTPHANTYLGPGKVSEARAMAKELDANLIACDDELTARQERNLEQEIGLPVV